MEEQPAYVEKEWFNKPIKKPKFFPKETKTIFESVIATLTHMQDENFAIKWDNVDFVFACTKCECIADVLKVETVPLPYRIDFYIGCPKCGKTCKKTIDLKPEKETRA
jgi:hypothetical protein